MVNIEIIDTGAPKAGPYNLGLKAGNLIFISGQVPDQEVKGIKEQTLSALEKIKKVLEAAGANVRSIVKIGVYLKNVDDFKEMNEALETAWQLRPEGNNEIEAELLNLLMMGDMLEREIRQAIQNGTVVMEFDANVVEDIPESDSK